MLKAGLNKKNSINNSNYRKKLPSTSEIDISSHSSWQKKCENGTDRKFPCPYLWYGTMIIRRCQNGDEKLFKSVKNGKAHEPQNFAAGNFAMKKYRSVIFFSTFSLSWINMYTQLVGLLDGCGLKFPEKRLLRKSDVQISVHKSTHSACATATPNSHRWFEKSYRIPRWN